MKGEGEGEGLGGKVHTNVVTIATRYTCKDIITL